MRTRPGLSPLVTPTHLTAMWILAPRLLAQMTRTPEVARVAAIRLAGAGAPRSLGTPAARHPAISARARLGSVAVVATLVVVGAWAMILVSRQATQAIHEGESLPGGCEAAGQDFR